MLFDYDEAYERFCHELPLPYFGFSLALASVLMKYSRWVNTEVFQQWTVIFSCFICSVKTFFCYVKRKRLFNYRIFKYIIIFYKISERLALDFYDFKGSWKLLPHGALLNHTNFFTNIFLIQRFSNSLFLYLTLLYKYLNVQENAHISRYSLSTRS